MSVIRNYTSNTLVAGTRMLILFTITAPMSRLIPVQAMMTFVIMTTTKFQLMQAKEMTMFFLVPVRT